MVKKLRNLAAIIAVVVFIFPTLSSAKGYKRSPKISKLSRILGFKDQFQSPKLGTVPLPDSKEMAYPYPDGYALLKVSFPDEVQLDEPFDISITYETTSDPYSFLMLFPQLFIPGGTNLPTQWRQVNTSLNPEYNSDKSGPIETLPSVDWVKENWGNWYGVGIAPFDSGSLLMHTTQDWSHGHYFWAEDSDKVTLTYSSFSFSQEGDYQFEVNPVGWYYDDDKGLIDNIEPVSFIIKAKQAPQNLIINPSFEIDANADGVPDSWTPFQFAPGDGTSSDFATEGLYSLKINGSPTKYKRVRQRIETTGSAGENLVLSGYNKTIGSSSTGGCIDVLVYLNNTDGTRRMYSLRFSKYAHDWLYRSTTITPSKSYSSIDVYVVYYLQTGTAFFDDLKLIK